ncbi:MAG: LysE family translocator [Armatimonadetes bacterium]|nr:MAG: LysE family translocator [Armatimonadota bacterium]
MPDTSTILLFALASFILVIIPGPAVVYILTRSVSQGRTAGLVSAVGVNVGSAVHVLAAVLGLSIILAQSAVAFTTIKWAGVFYLAWIGIRTLRAGDTIFEQATTERQALRRVFIQAILVNILNPKVAIFFLAFLPQFVDPDAANPALQTFVLGMTLIVVGLVSDSIYAIIGGRVGDLFRSKPRAARNTRIGAGLTYLTLAGVAAATGARSS